MKNKSYILVFVLVVALTSCLKRKGEEPSANEPINTNNTAEIITTMKVYIKDSISNNFILGSPFTFKDPDGDGGILGAFLPNASDSLITLDSNKTYFAEIILLDETKNPVDTISNAVIAEGIEHQFFFNQTNPIGNPYTTIVAGSGIKIIYDDIDANNRGVGQKIKIKTSSPTAGTQFPLLITLRHQPGNKDGTFAPGETDVEVKFKIKVN